MDLSELQTLIGDLTNDPNHDRYTLDQINLELENTQDKWNLSAKILKDTVTLTTVAGTRQYALTDLTGTPISFERVTHKGIELRKRDKNWFDLYAGDDWTDDVGTPSQYFIEAEDPDTQYITLYPIPQDADAGANLAVEYVKRHTSMSAETDTPFMSVSTAQTLMLPYHFGIAYDVAARLLSRDPNAENVARSVNYQRVANDVLTDVVQTFKNLEDEEPPRLRGGRRWVY